jgi:hypothetical protein
LTFDEGPGEQEWTVHGTVQRFNVEREQKQTYIGFSSPHGIVPLSTVLGYDSTYPCPFREMEYLGDVGSRALLISYFFSLHSLREVKLPLFTLENLPKIPAIPAMDRLPSPPPVQFSFSLPLLHTLKVLDVMFISSSILAGQTFHKLERYKERQRKQLGYHQRNLGMGLLTTMPVCTRLVVSLFRLATLKLPQVCELGVCIMGEKPNYVWEKHVAVNANLSGLKLLHLLNDFNDFVKWPTIDVIKILRSLPALETLVFYGKSLAAPYVNFFEAFVPVDVRATSGLNQSRWEGQISGVLCPMLESLQIEGIRLTEQPKLMPVLKDIVTLRAIIGSPLKSFTFFDWTPDQKWELIGKNGCFIMEEVLPAQMFQLEI